MFYYRLVFCCCLLAIVCCAPSSPKPEISASPPTVGSAGSSESNTNASATSGSVTSQSVPNADKSKDNKSTLSSSLDQFREGKSSASSASGPLKDVLFEFDRYDLTTEARDILRSNAEWLKKNASTRVEIEGHCDERGTNEYNLALAAKRAQTIRDYIVTLGITPDRISTISYGEEIPACVENNEGCWRQNRRARFVLASGRPAS